MISNRKLSISAGCAVFALLVVPILAFRVWIWQAQKALLRANHLAILAACRQLIGDRALYRQYASHLPYLPSATNDYVLTERELETDSVPQAIRDLRPKYVVIREDQVLIAQHAPHVGLLGFAAGKPQRGTTNLIDGLWYWNGNVHGSIPSQGTTPEK